MTPEQIKQLQIELNSRGANLKVDGILGPKTTMAMNNAVTGAISSNPLLSSLTVQNSPEAILDAYQNNNWSGVTDITGKPFSDEDQRLAVEKANAALSPYFEAEKRYEEENITRKIEDKNRAYKEYLDNSGASFQEDKKTLDQDAANKGVLFSGGRIEKEKNLKDMYERDQETKLANIGSDIGSLASGYQYKYGDEAANKPKISELYNLNTNTYNPNVARNGVGMGSLSTVYNPKGKNFQGTAVNTNKANVQTRAASLLSNKANKILPYGYQKQY